MQILGIIPARGGSKGLPGKNIRNLGGLPLIAHTIRASQQTDLLAAVIVSTDDEQIAAVARDYGASVPFLRPPELSTDTAKSIDVVLHALHFMEAKRGEPYTHVMLLQPTCPLRDAADIDAAIAQMQNTPSATAIISVYQPQSAHPYSMFFLDDDGQHMQPLLPDIDNPHHRQSYPAVYMLNGGIYLTRREVIVNEHNFYGEMACGLVMEAMKSVNIDDALDLALAETILRLREAPQ